jgi:hypothetical protein
MECFPVGRGAHAVQAVLEPDQTVKRRFQSSEG